MNFTEVCKFKPIVFRIDYVDVSLIKSRLIMDYSFIHNSMCYTVHVNKKKSSVLWQICCCDIWRLAALSDETVSKTVLLNTHTGIHGVVCDIAEAVKKYFREAMFLLKVGQRSLSLKGKTLW